MALSNTEKQQNFRERKRYLERRVRELEQQLQALPALDEEANHIGRFSVDDEGIPALNPDVAIKALASHFEVECDGRNALDLLAGVQDAILRTTPNGYPKRIVEKFGDTKWHALPVIAKHLDAPEDEVERSLAGMAKLGWGDAKTEAKRVGTVKHYRMFRHTRMISSAELADKLSPILDGLQAEGKKTMATMSPWAVATLAHKLRKLLKEWTE